MIDFIWIDMILVGKSWHSRECKGAWIMKLAESGVPEYSVFVCWLTHSTLVSVLPLNWRGKRYQRGIFIFCFGFVCALTLFALFFFFNFPTIVVLTNHVSQFVSKRRKCSQIMSQLYPTLVGTCLKGLDYRGPLWETIMVRSGSSSLPTVFHPAVQLLMFYNIMPS